MRGRADPVELTRRLRAWTRTLIDMGVDPEYIPGFHVDAVTEVPSVWELPQEAMTYPAAPTVTVPDDVVAWLEWAGNFDSVWAAMTNMEMLHPKLAVIETAVQYVTLGPYTDEVPTQIDVAIVMSDLSGPAVGVVIDTESEWFGCAAVVRVEEPPALWNKLMFLPSLLSVVDCWELALTEGRYKSVRGNLEPRPGFVRDLYLPAAIETPPPPLTPG